MERQYMNGLEPSIVYRYRVESSIDQPWSYSRAGLRVWVALSCSYVLVKEPGVKIQWRIHRECVSLGRELETIKLNLKDRAFGEKIKNTFSLKGLYASGSLCPKVSGYLDNWSFCTGISICFVKEGLEEERWGRELRFVGRLFMTSVNDEAGLRD